MLLAFFRFLLLPLTALLASDAKTDGERHMKRNRDRLGRSLSVDLKIPYACLYFPLADARASRRPRRN